MIIVSYYLIFNIVITYPLIEKITRVPIGECLFDSDYMLKRHFGLYMVTYIFGPFVFLFIPYFKKQRFRFHKYYHMKELVYKNYNGRYEHEITLLKRELNIDKIQDNMKRNKASKWFNGLGVVVKTKKRLYLNY